MWNYLYSPIRCCAVISFTLDRWTVLESIYRLWSRLLTTLEKLLHHHAKICHRCRYIHAQGQHISWHKNIYQWTSVMRGRMSHGEGASRSQYDRSTVAHRTSPWQQQHCRRVEWRPSARCHADQAACSFISMIYIAWWHRNLDGIEKPLHGLATVCLPPFGSLQAVTGFDTHDCVSARGVLNSYLGSVFIYERIHCKRSSDER